MRFEQQRKPRRRIKITHQDLDEILEARDWCRERGWVGLPEYYTDLLGQLEFERRLPGRGPSLDEEAER